MTKHTPGEWWNESGVIHAKSPKWTEDNHSYIHIAHGIENENDAELMAAAPKLLEALKGYDQIVRVVIKALERDGGIRAEMAAELKEKLGIACELRQRFE